MQAEGTHTPAMLAEVLRRLVHDPSGVYVDGTFGRGGHTRAILEKLSPEGRLHSFDVDAEAIEVGKELMAQDPRFTIHQRWFGDMAEELGPLGVKPAGVLLVRRLSVLLLFLHVVHLLCIFNFFFYKLG